MDTETLVTVAVDHLVQERDLAFQLTVHFGAHLEVLDPCQLVGERRELVEMGREQAEAANVGRNVLADGPRETETVIGRSTAAELVDDDQRITSGRPQDGGRLEHLGHERRHALELAVASTHTRKDAVKDGQLGRVGGDKAAQLGHERNDANLANVRRLAAHVGTRQNVELGGAC